MKRRTLIKGLTLLPLAQSLSANAVHAFPDQAGETLRSFLDNEFSLVEGPLKPGPNIYQSIGVQPVINCRGTFSIIGGSLERPEVREAMDSAAKHFVQYDELAEGVGRRLAEITGAEWGLVSSGCSGVLKLLTIACVTGGNPEKLHRIPDLTGFEKNEVIIPRGSQSAYDFSIQAVGVKIIRVDTVQEFQDALSSRTAMIKVSGGSLEPGELGLDSIARMAKPFNVPILADAAAEILTIPNVHLRRGATVVAYSGGKVLCGPQCAGLVFGRKDILMSAWQASSPHHGPGRDNKVGREEMLGMLAAVENWVTRDHSADWKNWLSWLNSISDRLRGIESLATQISEPTGLGNKSPKLTISWDPSKLNITGEEVSELLVTTKPRITLGAERATGKATTSISIVAFQMQPGESKIVANRLYEVLKEKRAPRTTVTLKPATVNITGQWDVTIDFYSGQSKHTWFFQQEGNNIQGSHQGDFSNREISGIVEGDQVKVLSPAPRPSPTFIFWGIASGDVITGKINMGEYLDASFTAKRHIYPTTSNPITIPQGRSMSS